MNSCHLAQCEMMGHSCATRRAGAEFTIIHANLPCSPSPPSTPSPRLLLLLLPLPFFHMPGSAEYGWRWRDGKRREVCRDRGVRERWSVSLTEVFLLSPVSHLRRCGTGINGIQQHGEIAAGSVCYCVCMCLCAHMYAASEVQYSAPCWSHDHQWLIKL